MNTDQQELAAYQRAVELAKDELSALRRRAELAEALALTLEKQRDQAEEDALVTRAAILEWKNAYDRLAGVFDLRIAVDECHAALAGYVGSYYDVVLGEMAKRAERAEAELALARAALDQIDKMPVGAYEVDWSNMPEPCEECGEMHEIANQALAAMKKVRAE